MFESGTKTNDTDGIVGAAATFVLLVAADDKRSEGDTFFDVKGADTDRAADFMSAKSGIIES